MNEHTGQPEITPELKFPTILQGREALVTVVRNDGRYKVLIDEDFAAQLELEEDCHSWQVTAGELNDYDLIREIGQRIEAKFS